MPDERVTSLDDERLAVFRHLKQRNSVRDARLFVAEGPTVVERVLRSDFEMECVLISDRKWNSFSRHLAQNTPVLRISNALAEELIGFSFHAGVMASVRRRPAPLLGALVPGTAPSLILAGDQICDPENVGAMIRIAAAFGAAGVVLGPGSADAFSRRVLRVSMGNVLFLPVCETDNLGAALDQLCTEHGFATCATVADAQSQDLSGFAFPPRTVLMFGNEYSGLSDGIIRTAQHRLTIPMRNGTDSLNVAVSAGIFAWQYRQQWC